MSGGEVLARNLLTPNGALICAIDHNEQENIGILLRELFGDKEITCVTIVHNPRGIQGNNFSYTHENAYFVYPKGKFINKIPRSEDEQEWSNLRNWGGDSTRDFGYTLFYPLYFKDNKLIEIGEVPEKTFQPKKSYQKRDDGVIEIYPIDNNGIERKWRYARDSLSEIKHLVKLELVSGIPQAQLLKVDDRIKTVWTDKRYDANIYGSQLLKEIVDKDFPFPKSLYTVKDCLEAVVKNNKTATIVDFFAGSGTTGHAVFELNKTDGGNRKFILCTNNEANICEDITYTRIKNLINGYPFKGKSKEIIFEKKLSPTIVSKGLKSDLDQVISANSAKFDDIKVSVEENHVRVLGIKSINGKKDGLGKNNLRYFKTSFVKNSRNKDQLKIDITKRCTEMLCLKEGVYNLYKEHIENKEPVWKIFKQGKKYLAVYYDFAGEELETLRKEMSNLKGNKVLYCFTTDPQGLDKNSFSDWKGVKLEPIPQKILDIYNKIFQ